MNGLLLLSSNLSETLFNYWIFLGFLSILPMLLGIIIAIAKYRTLNASKKIIAIFLMGSLIFDIISRSIDLGSSDNNLIIVNSYALFELLLFYLFLQKSYKSKLLSSLYILALLWNICEFNIINFSDSAKYISFSRFINYMIILIHTGSIILNNLGTYYKNNIEFIYMSIGIYTILNGLISLVISIIINYNKYNNNSDYELAYILLIIQSIIIIAFYCCCCWYLFKKQEENKSINIA